MEKLLRKPRREIPHRQEADRKRPTYAADPQFYRDLLKECMLLLHDTPGKAAGTLRIALRLTPYVQSTCLVSEAWSLLSSWHRLQHQYAKAEVALAHASSVGKDCPACIARLERPLALQRLHQGRVEEALAIIEKSITYYEEQYYDTNHDLEPDSLARSLFTKAYISYYTSNPSGAVICAGRALSLVSPLRSPQLYENLIINFPHILAASGRREDLLEANARIDEASSHLAGLPRYSSRREKVRWIRYRIKYRLGYATGKQVERQLRKAREVFIEEKMGREVVVITTHIGEIADLSTNEIRDLILDLGKKTKGQIEIFSWIPENLHERLRKIYRTACAWDWREYQKVFELLKELREAAGGKEVMPI